MADTLSRLPTRARQGPISAENSLRTDYQSLHFLLQFGGKCRLQFARGNTFHTSTAPAANNTAL